MTQLLYHPEALALPWHEVLEPCLNCLSGPSGDSEVPEPWQGLGRERQLLGAPAASGEHKIAFLDGSGCWEAWVRRRRLMSSKSLQTWASEVRACVPDIAGLVPDHCNKMSIAIKRVS